MSASVIEDLSVNWRVDLAQSDDGSGEGVECNESVLKLLVAHQQLAEPVEPAVISA